MSREDAFYFAGDLSEAGDDRTRLDLLERRLEVFLEAQRQEVERLRQIRQSWCMFTNTSKSIPHNTNTLINWDSLSYNPSGWGVGTGDTRIFPQTPGYYRVGGLFFPLANLPASSRFLVVTRLNGVSTFGSVDLTPVSGSPDLCPGGRILPMNGDNDYIDAVVYQFQGSGTAAVNVFSAITVEMVDHL